MYQGKYYSLTWHAYSDYLKTMMKELLMNEDYSDVTLVTEDKKQIKANINILRACSPVFKDILKKEKNSSIIMYLSGIQFSEMESIIQFIYLGEATFYEERMDRFLAVAKSLQIKELCDAENETEKEPFKPIPRDSTENLKEEETVISDNVSVQAPQIVSDNFRFECDQCDKTYLSREGVKKHKQTAHEGVKYPCDQCDYQATRKYHLTVHIQSMHEGVKWVCDQCEQMFSRNHLREHIKNKLCFSRSGRKPNPKPGATATSTP